MIEGMCAQLTSFCAKAAEVGRGVSSSQSSGRTAKTPWGKSCLIAQSVVVTPLLDFGVGDGWTL